MRFFWTIQFQTKLNSWSSVDSQGSANFTSDEPYVSTSKTFWWKFCLVKRLGLIGMIYSMILVYLGKFSEFFLNSNYIHSVYWFYLDSYRCPFFYTKIEDSVFPRNTTLPALTKLLCPTHPPPCQTVRWPQRSANDGGCLAATSMVIFIGIHVWYTYSLQ